MAAVAAVRASIFHCASVTYQEHNHLDRNLIIMSVCASLLQLPALVDMWFIQEKRLHDTAAAHALTNVVVLILELINIGSVVAYPRHSLPHDSKVVVVDQGFLLSDSMYEGEGPKRRGTPGIAS